MPEAAKVSNVLLVEDEPRVRQLVAKVLRRRGYVVLEAEDAEAALRLFGSQASDISLLLTDVVMPGMSGHDLADSLSAAHPELKVIFMSGYSETDLPSRDDGDVSAHHLSKPFTAEVLYTLVEGVLAR